MDLAAWWKARRWVALLELIDQLPRTARTRAAMVNDPQFAKEWLEREGQDDDEAPEWTPPLTEWDTRTQLEAEQRDLLLDAVRLLAGIRHGIQVVNVKQLRPAPRTGGKPFPRPRTAIDEARETAARAAAHQVLTWFFPHATNN